MYTNIGTFSVTDLRHQTSNVLKMANEQGFVILLRNSKPEAAVVDIKYLDALREAYEDQLDTIEFDRTINLKRIPLDQHIKQMRIDK